MKKRKYILAFVLIVFTFSVFAQQRTRVNFNQGWKFLLNGNSNYYDPAFKDDAWRTLDLPHDWSIEGNFSEDHPAGFNGGALPGGVGWYRKTFTLPLSDKGRILSIQFDGVYRNSEVWINGHLLGKRPNGYISFHYNLTPFLKYGTNKNVIAVKVKNAEQPNSRWYSGSGIYRNTWLEKTNSIHIDHWGTFITTPTINDRAATVAIAYKIANESNNAETVTIVHEIYDSASKKVASVVNNDEVHLEGSFVNGNAVLTISNPIRWSVNRPYLYKMITKVVKAGAIIDSYITKFGIRDFHFDNEKGFILNGQPLKILGVCNHHDLGALGAAFNTRAAERQLQILKAMGVNGLRTSHNPPAPELLDLCDSMGFIVIDEAFDIWAKQKTKYDYALDWKDWHVKDLQDQILRDRNHPSIFVWSVGNEIGEQYRDDKNNDTSGRVIARELVTIVKQLDSTRAIVTANNDVSTGNNLILSGAFDLIGYNYNHADWASFPQRWPGKSLIVTESTSALETRGFYELINSDTIRRWPKRWDIPFSNPNGGYTVSAYDHVSAPWGSTHEESIKALKLPHVSGMFIWTGFDYLGEPTPYGWPARSSYFGIVDLAGFPKDVYYLYQSEFTNKPVLHIYPHWNWKKGDTVDVVCYYNNADEVELFLNGRSVGTRQKSGDALHVKWRLPFSPGSLKAVSKKDGRTVKMTEVKTAGPASKIVLTADRKLIHADGKDLSFIKASVVDKNGVLVPGANNLIQFKISGQGFIAGVDSGDPVSHEPFKSDKHTALNGLALAIVQSLNKKGSISVTAISEGLQGAVITLQTK